MGSPDWWLAPLGARAAQHISWGGGGGGGGGGRVTGRRLDLSHRLASQRGRRGRYMPARAGGGAGEGVTPPPRTSAPPPNSPLPTSAPGSGYDLEF